jgi:hypothetical protein
MVRGDFFGGGRMGSLFAPRAKRTETNRGPTLREHLEQWRAEHKGKEKDEVTRWYAPASIAGSPMPVNPDPVIGYLQQRRSDFGKVREYEDTISRLSWRDLCLIWRDTGGMDEMRKIYERETGRKVQQSFWVTMPLKHIGF